MSDNSGSKISYFLVGLGVGALLGILFAPKSGEETREYLREKAEEGREYAQRKAKELRERAEEMVERGKEFVSSQKEQVSAALDAGKEAYQREKSKAH
ncbi:MAG TPA: YtxH domain-containing protein [Candidatus Nitrosotenuis sp.]|nr:YtxH domain-containing protein [Candidatus Nitrosotenuis sp.]